MEIGNRLVSIVKMPPEALPIGMFEVCPLRSATCSSCYNLAYSVAALPDFLVRLS